MAAMLGETSAGRNHGPHGNEAHKRGKKHNKSSDSSDSEEKKACKFLRKQLSAAVDSGELCISELLSAEAADPLFGDINEVLSDVNNNIFTCDVTNQNENCAKIASAAVLLNDVLLSCDVKGDARTLASNAFIAEFTDASKTAIRQFLNNNIPSDNINTLAESVIFPSYSLDPIFVTDEDFNATLEIINNNTFTFNIPGLIESFNTMREFVSSKCVKTAFGSFSTSFESLIDLVEAGNFSFGLRRPPNKTDVILLQNEVIQLRNDFMNILDSVIGCEITEEVRNDTRVFFQVAVQGALLAKAQCIGGQVSDIIGPILASNGTQTPFRHFINVVAKFISPQQFVALEAASDYYLFGILAVRRNRAIPRVPEFVISDADLRERFLVYARELIAVQQDVCQVVLSAEEISIIENYYTGRLLNDILNPGPILG